MAFSKLFNDVEECDIISRYIGGDSVFNIATSLGVTHGTIKNILVRSQISLRSHSDVMRRYAINHDAFDAITPSSAYWVGVLMADGNVAWRGNTTAITTLAQAEVDTQHVLKFQEFLGTNKPTRLCRGGGFNKSQSYQCHLSVTSAKIANDLAKHGVVPRKTYTANTPTLGMDRDFWRGVVDGDGSIFFKEKFGHRGRWLYGRATLSLCGSRGLMEQFATFCDANGIFAATSVHDVGKVASFVCTGKTAIDLIELLYANATTFLDRKMELARRIAELVAIHKPKGRPRHVTQKRKAVT